MKKELIHKLVSAGVHLKVIEGNLKVNAPKGVLTKELLDEIKSNKEYLINLLSSKTTIPNAELSENYPVTPAQRRLWILSKFEGGNSAYNITNEFQFQGIFDNDKFLSAFKILIKRHESLRTYFKEDAEGELKQYIIPFSDIDFDIDFYDVSNLGSTERGAFVIKNQSYTFDLTKAPLLKIQVLKESENQHLLLFNLHHMVGDGWSLEVLSREFILVYNSLLRNEEIVLEPLSIQYKDYAVWLESEEQQKKKIQSEEFWIENLSGELPVLELPQSKKRPKMKTYKGAAIEYTFSTRFSEVLKKLVQEEEASLFMGLLTGVNGLLYRYTQKTDLIVGTAVAGREHPDLMGQIGLYLNTLAIRTQFNDDIGFKELLSVQKSILLDSYKHQSYPFNEVIDKLDVKRDTSRSALFDVMVILQNQHNANAVNDDKLEGIKVQPYHTLNTTTSQFDLNFSFVEYEKTIKVTLEFNTDLYDKEFVTKLLRNLESFVIQGVESPDLPISTINYLSAEERNELLFDFNNTQIEYPKEDTILDKFQKQVDRSPDQIAISFGDQKLTYKELNERSNQLANHLVSNGIKNRAIVALCVERSCEMVIGMLGILKAGAAYLPLDPAYPLERLDYIIKDSKAALVLTKKEIKAFIAKPNLEVLCFENEDIWNDSKHNLSKLSSDLLAYVIYTSGTTGNPKGVKISHQNVLNFFIGLDHTFEPSTKDEVWLAVTSMSFDISVLELLWTITRGSKVIIKGDNPAVSSPMRGMDFSLLYFATHEAIATKKNKYNLLLKGAEFADHNQFQGIWIPERHFHSFGDQFPNPSVAAAAVAARTQNVTIRSGSVVIPLHDPVRVAEEWSMVDNLSDGRVELSIASGWHPNDFVLASGNYEDRHQVMKDRITILKDLWKGKSLVRKNGLNQDFEFRIHPKPIQDELKIWVTASRSVETFRYAGSIGANVLTRLLGQNIEDLKEKIQVYRDTLREHGFDPEKGKVAVMLHTFVSDDASFVKKTVETPFKNYLKNSVSLIKPIAADANLDLDNDFEAIVEMVFQKFYKTSCLFGTPETCFSRVKELHDIGVNEIASMLDFGIDEEIVLNNLKHLKSLNEMVNRNKSQYEFLIKGQDNRLSIAQLVKQHKVNHLQSTPSFIHELLLDDDGEQALKQIETLLVGGEALPQTLSDELLDIRKKPTFNMYGPTETTIWSTIKKITKKETVNIGKPIANTQIYILDHKKELCPVGVVGELCIGGDGVSQGYIGREDLNKEKFLDHPFLVSDSNKKIYRTGDLAKWLPNGELECLGRIDNQVKLRGHRIELGEIENVLRKKEDIIDNAVGITTNTIGEKELTAYIVSDNKEALQGLRSYVLKYLPQYMVPAKYVRIEKLPLTPNGKLDRKSLASLHTGPLSSGVAYVAARNEVEEKLVSIWQEILGIDKIGIKDDFFDLGGHSIRATKVLSKVNKEFDVEISIKNLFNAPTIENLASQIAFVTKQKKMRLETETLKEIAL